MRIYGIPAETCSDCVISLEIKGVNGEHKHRLIASIKHGEMKDFGMSPCKSLNQVNIHNTVRDQEGYHVLFSHASGDQSVSPD